MFMNEENKLNLGIVIMRFLLVVTSPIVNIIWLLLIISEFISKLIYKSKLSKRWQRLIEGLFKNAV